MYLPVSGEIAFGKRSAFFRRGYYLYTGSAFGSGGLEKRLQRHLSKEKKLYWHIDYFLERAKVKETVIFELEKEFEHRLARGLTEIDGIEPAVERFGSGDCDCETHLFRCGKETAGRIKTITGKFYKA